MTDPFVAEIRIVGFNFAPTGYANCNGQLIPISQNTALFSLLGTFYGGDGKSTFALPDLTDRAPMHVGASGAGPGLSQHSLGEQSGVEFVTLLQSEMPIHTHTLRGNTEPGLSPLPEPDGVPAKTEGDNAYNAAGSQALMHPQALALAGGSLPHNNMMPTLTMRFVIAMQGVFPPRC